MHEPRTDLDRLAAGYDHRPPGPGSLARADRAARRASLRPGTLAVDVGGGRGWQASRFVRTGAEVVLVDRSAAQLRVGDLDGVVRVRGDARRLPLDDAVADLVWFQAVLHHGGWQTMLDEAVRVARPGGLIEAWTFRVEHARRSFLARWFPTVGEVDEARFPDPHAMAARLASSGCVDVSVVAVDELVVRGVAAWERAVRGGFVSTLQAVPAEELERGLGDFRRTHPDPTAAVAYPLRYAGVSGRTPSLP